MKTNQRERMKKLNERRREKEGKDLSHSSHHNLKVWYQEHVPNDGVPRQCRQQITNDTYITVTYSTCDDNDTPVTLRHLVDDAGKERDLIERQRRTRYVSYSERTGRQRRMRYVASLVLNFFCTSLMSLKAVFKLEDGADSSPGSLVFVLRIFINTPLESQKPSMLLGSYQGVPILGFID
ncbi:hypothetical protein E2C01_022266 [Portunus trituberculatus]|uniref:Uncharacterized protein n=1 Tax=Portunus trituberculatus TaxID=210409 RepID=A0A5B7E6K6_PORTR|nr:hypothetical protein [Portunus trituberculatus]